MSLAKQAQHRLHPLLSLLILLPHVGEFWDFVMLELNQAQHSYLLSPMLLPHAN